VNRYLRNIIIVFLITVGTHALAVTYLPQDFDEPVYVEVAMDYARFLRSGDLNAIIEYPNVREHPELVKLSYAVAIHARGNADNYSTSLHTSRIVSAVFGVFATVLLALFDPFAGGLMAIHALVVKYSSQAYLEAIPLAFTTLAVLAFLKTNRENRDAWFWLSAVALGASTAGKFTYTPVLVVVLIYLAFFEKKIPFRWMVAFGALAVGVFFALNVALWHQPVERVIEALQFHANYQRGAHVTEVNYPWYQPFKWIFTDTPGDWHGGIFLYDIDPFIAAFAFAGILREWRERRWLVVWLVTGMILLLLWGTKWPQYVLTIVPAICLMAAESARRFYKWFTTLSYYRSV
jgi:4-amino-4-deoxy-L-arabinose transferase-like glycosyltransferase